MKNPRDSSFHSEPIAHVDHFHWQHIISLKMSARKRVISSCIPCYTRKQKCNREYPCNHCTRRQCTEDCIYRSTTENQTSSPSALPESRTGERPRGKTKSGGSGSLISSRNECNTCVKSVSPTVSCQPPWSLVESFGYFEGSNSNTLALVQNMRVACPADSSCRSFPTLIPEAADEVHRNLERMPDRQIVDFLVQYFVAEVHWMDQLVHVPWFLSKYQAWWLVERVTLVAEAEFVILILRICSYTLQFLPSPAYALDKIRGVLLADVRSMCDETADNLEAINTAADSRGSLMRVQHRTFLGLQCQMEGKTDGFLEALSCAIRVAQNIGIHCDSTRTGGGRVDNTDREMERRAFCNLYIWDSLLSRQLDRIPFLPGRLQPGNRPQLHLPRRGSGGGGDDTEPAGLGAPDPFIERLLQADLADFWRGVGRPVQGAEYDILAAEERYDKFCRQYLSQLPPAFALVDPDETWSKRFPKLPLQRMLLHIAIYESICWNFRPLLLRRPAPLPAYKSVMLSWQKRKLAAAALRALASVTQLHTLLQDCHTRLAGIIVSTFEAAVLLVSLSTDPTFPEELPQQHIPPPDDVLKTDPLQTGIYSVTLLGCLQAVKGALKRLKMLAEVSPMASIGANTLTQLLSKASELSARTEAATVVASMVQNQGVGSTAAAATCPITTPTTTGPTGATAAAGEVASWMAGDLADLRPTSDFTWISPTIAVEDMGSWPFDTSNMYSQQVTPVEDWTAHGADFT